MTTRLLALVGVTAAATAATGAVFLSRGPASAQAGTATALLAPTNEKGVRGAGYFRQEGRSISGWIVVWGLAPGSEHAVHIHGPDARCGNPPAPAVAAHEDVVAGADGVAFARFRMTAEDAVVRGGFYYNVHAEPASAPENPELACGDLVPVP